jgi:hypothetical protein
VVKEAQAGAVPPVAIRGGLLEAKTLDMYKPVYDGVVELTTATGPKKALKFRMDKAVNTPFSLTIDEAGSATTVITSDKLTTAMSTEPLGRSKVEFYTTKFVGKLFGIPLVFTPELPPPFIPPLEPITFTDVRIDLAFVSCDKLTAEPLSIVEKP